MNTPPLIVANLKMNVSLPAAAEYVRRVIGHAAEHAFPGMTVICPDFLAINVMQQCAQTPGFALGAQDVCWETRGAFTGQISASDLVHAGCRYVIIGHSERRLYAGETDDLIARKVHCALAHGLNPIICVGETREERDAGRTSGVIVRQLETALGSVALGMHSAVYVAYEPRWAIGAGVRVSGAEIASARELCMQVMRERFSAEQCARGVGVLYGGSVDVASVEEILGSGVQGVLVGTAAKDPDTLCALVRRSASYA